MHGNLLELPTRTVRLLMILSTRSIDRAQRLLQYIDVSLLECQTHVLCFDHINFMNRVEMLLKMNVTNDVWMSTLLIWNCFTFPRIRDREAAYLSVFFPVYSSSNKFLQQSFVEILLTTWMINYIRPIIRHFDHVFEELGIRNWTWPMTLNRSNVCWRVVVILVSASLKTDSIRSQFRSFRTLSDDIRVDLNLSLAPKSSWSHANSTLLADA